MSTTREKLQQKLLKQQVKALNTRSAASIAYAAILSGDEGAFNTGVPNLFAPAPKEITYYRVQDGEIKLNTLQFDTPPSWLLIALLFGSLEFARQQMQRAFAAADANPTERTETLRNVFSAIIKLPDNTVETCQKKINLLVKFAQETNFRFTGNLAEAGKPYECILDCIVDCLGQNFNDFPKLFPLELSEQLKQSPDYYSRILYSATTFGHFHLLHYLLEKSDYATDMRSHINDFVAEESGRTPLAATVWDIPWENTEISQERRQMDLTNAIECMRVLLEFGASPYAGSHPHNNAPIIIAAANNPWLLCHLLVDATSFDSGSVDVQKQFMHQTLAAVLANRPGGAPYLTMLLDSKLVAPNAPTILNTMVVQSVARTPPTDVFIPPPKKTPVRTDFAAAPPSTIAQAKPLKIQLSEASSAEEARLPQRFKIATPRDISSVDLQTQTGTLLQIVAYLPDNNSQETAQMVTTLLAAGANPLQRHPWMNKADCNAIDIAAIFANATAFITMCLHLKDHITPDFIFNALLNLLNYSNESRPDQRKAFLIKLKLKKLIFTATDAEIRLKLTLTVMHYGSLENLALLVEIDILENLSASQLNIFIQNLVTFEQSQPNIYALFANKYASAISAYKNPNPATTVAAADSVPVTAEIEFVVGPRSDAPLFNHIRHGRVILQDLIASTWTTDVTPEHQILIRKFSILYYLLRLTEALSQSFQGREGCEDDYRIANTTRNFLMHVLAYVDSIDFNDLVLLTTFILSISEAFEFKKHKDSVPVVTPQIYTVLSTRLAENIEQAQSAEVLLQKIKTYLTNITQLSANISRKDLSRQFERNNAIKMLFVFVGQCYRAYLDLKDNEQVPENMMLSANTHVFLRACIHLRGDAAHRFDERPRARAASPDLFGAGIGQPAAPAAETKPGFTGDGITSKGLRDLLTDVPNVLAKITALLTPPSVALTQSSPGK